MLSTVTCGRHMNKYSMSLSHDDVIRWKHFLGYWPFVRGIHRSPTNSSHKSQWRGALTFSLICAWINDWVNIRGAGDLRRHHAHYHVIVMQPNAVMRLNTPTPPPPPPQKKKKEKKSSTTFIKELRRQMLSNVLSDNTYCEWDAVGSYTIMWLLNVVWIPLRMTLCIIFLRWFESNRWFSR